MVSTLHKAVNEETSKTYTALLDEFIATLSRAFPLAVRITQDAYRRHHGARSLVRSLASEGRPDVVVAVVIVAAAATEMRSVVFGGVRQTRRAIDAVVAVDGEIVGSEIAHLCVAKVSSVSCASFKLSTAPALRMCLRG